MDDQSRGLNEYYTRIKAMTALMTAFCLFLEEKKVRSI